MADDFDDIADAFEEAADAIEDAFNGDDLGAEEEIEDVPDVPDVSVDVPGEPDFTFPTLRDVAGEVDEALELLEAELGEGALRDEQFWRMFTESLDVDIEPTAIQSPLEEREQQGTLPTEVIEGIDPSTVVEPSPAEGEVNAATTAEEVTNVSPHAFKETLISIRSLDQKLDRLDRAHNDLRGAKETIEERLEQLGADAETLQDAIDRGEGDVEVMQSVLDDIEVQIEGGLDLIQEAERKMAVIEERGNRLRQDRNEYRAEVKAILNYARQDGTNVSVDQLQEVYRGHRIRSGADVPFRPPVIRHVFSAMHTRQNRGDTWVPLGRLADRLADVWGYDEEEAGRAVQVLLTTGELEQRENQVRLSPLTE